MHQRATVAPPVGARQSGATARPVDIIEADPEERVVAPLDAPSGPIFMQGELVDGVYEVRGLLVIWHKMSLASLVGCNRLK